MLNGSQSVRLESRRSPEPKSDSAGVSLVRRTLRRPWRAWLRMYRPAVRYLRPNLRDLYYRYTPFKIRTPLPTPMGFKMAGGNSVFHLKMMQGQFEKEEVRGVLALAGDADVFVDVGSNIGYYACLVRQQNKHVVAVEPQSANFRFLCENLVANGWEDAEAYPVGLAQKPGIAVLYGISSTSASMLPGWSGGLKAFRQVIPVTTLDHLLAGRAAHERLLIKIDVEGVEYEVLLGARHTLRRTPKPIFIVEVCLGEFNPSGTNPHFVDTFRMFWENGYEARLMNGQQTTVTREEVERWARTGRTDTGCYDYLFVPRVA